MKALISDIHGNLEALEVALEKIAELGIDLADVYCLGDVIGYGASPAECAKYARSFAWNIQGNHEAALLTGGRKFNPRAKAALKWTMDQLESDQMYWITDWGTRVDDQETGYTFVHASPRHHTEEYILPDHGKVPDFMAPLFGMFDSVCFVGHTHIPGVFRRDFTYQHPDEFGGILDLADESDKVIVNIGSVGQPRDEIVDGCFCTLDGTKLTWIRFPYDVEAAAQRIYDAEQLDNQLGDRLKLGR